MRLFAAEYGAGTAGAAADAAASALADRAGQVSGRGHDPAADHRRHADRSGPALPVRHPGDDDHPAGYLGFVLLGMACLAIGQLFSALTQNQIVAALITAGGAAGFWFVGHLQTFQTSAPSAPGRLPLVRRPLRRIQAGAHRGGRVLPDRLGDRVDAQCELSPMAPLRWTARSARNLILLRWTSPRAMPTSKISPERNERSTSTAPL